MIGELRNEVYYIFGRPNINEKMLTGVTKLIAGSYQKKKLKIKRMLINQNNKELFTTENELDNN